MSLLSVKHENQQVVEFRDFSGGLNTSNAEEMIGMNELSLAVNVEIDKSTGFLRTVAGVSETDPFYQRIGHNEPMLIWDSINNVLLHSVRRSSSSASPRLIDLYIYSLKTLTGENGETLTYWARGATGVLTGKSIPVYASWENGLLIASGGKLQYFEKYKDGNDEKFRLTTLTDSPSVCNGVFIKDGRVWTYYDDILHASAIGDETSWAQDSNDDSSSQWVQIGYKDGGKIVAVTNLSSDTLIFKDNHHAYRLSGQYPNWTVSEISRDISCRGQYACVSLVNETIVLGNDSLYIVSVTQDYGNMRADDVGKKVKKRLQELPDNIRLRYLPPLNQIWFINVIDADEEKKDIFFLARKVLIYDINTGAFFEREFAVALRDVIYTGNEILLAQASKLGSEMGYFQYNTYITALDYDSYNLDIADYNSYYEGIPEAHISWTNINPEYYSYPTPLYWHWRGKALISHNNYLVKRVQADIVPLVGEDFTCNYHVANVTVGGDLQGLGYIETDSYTKSLLHFDRYKNFDQCGRKWECGYMSDLTRDNAKFGQSLHFLDLTQGLTTTMDLGGVSFTIDFWMYIPNKTGNFVTGIMMVRHGEENTMDDCEVMLVVDHSESVPTWKTRKYKGTSIKSTVVDSDLGKWHHVAISYEYQRTSMVSHMYISLDGFITSKIPDGTSGWINRQKWDIAIYGEYIDEVRVSDGVARWTENFTPPTKPYRLSWELPFTYREDKRCVSRVRTVNLDCQGEGAQVIFGGIKYDVAEV